MIGSLIFGLFMGLLCAGLALPLVLRRVRPNRLYGFRHAKTLADPQVWYEANAYAGKWLLGTGILTIVVALALYFVPNLDWAHLLVWGTVLVVGAILSMVQSLRYLRRFDGS